MRKLLLSLVCEVGQTIFPSFHFFISKINEGPGLYFGLVIKGTHMFRPYLDPPNQGVQGWDPGLQRGFGHTLLVIGLDSLNS